MERVFFVCYVDTKEEGIIMTSKSPDAMRRKEEKKETLLFLYVYVKLFHARATHCGPSNSMLATFQHKLIGLFCSSLNISQQNHIGDTPLHRHPTSPDCSLSINKMD